ATRQLLHEPLESRMLLHGNAPSAIFAPGTPQEYVDSFNDSLWPGDDSLVPEGAEAYRTGGRWTTPASGPSPNQGDPVVLTWGIVPDGTPLDGNAPSDLIAFMDGIYGTAPGPVANRPWFSLFQSTYDRWSEVSGITFVYEPNDDRAVVPDTSGQLGVRPDMRVGGHAIDGDYGILGYNWYPQWGDMVIDTSDVFYLNLPSLGLRNVVAHETGHGLGLSHTEPANGTKLMEPYLSMAFDGPQHDDILGVQRLYGDNLEPNDTPATATYLGAFATVRDVSIDDDTDIDVYSFGMADEGLVTISVTPYGFVYDEGPQGGPYTTIDTRAFSNLRFDLLDSDGVTVLAAVNATPAGYAESLANYQLNSAGTYYIRVRGAADQIQMYTLDLKVSSVPLGPRLFAVRPNDGDLLVRDAITVLDVSPREMRFLFKGGSNLDPATLDGIRITRAGADQEFDVASTRSGLGTSGQVVVEFRANQLWEQQNGIQVVLTESDHGEGSGPAPTISVVGNRIFVDLNRHAGAKTTAGAIVDAINHDSVAGKMITASIDRDGSLSATPESVPVTDFILDPASVTTDFDTSARVRFTARQSGSEGNLISVVVTRSDHGDASGPTIAVTGKTIRIDLNTNLGNETTAQQLVDALNADLYASQLVVVDLLPLLDVDLTVGDPANFSPIALTNGGDVAASVTSDFGTAGAVLVEFLALTAPNGTTIEVTRSDHGDTSGPTVDVPAGFVPPKITIDLNARLGAETTAEQLVAAVNSHADAGVLVRARVASRRYTEFTGLTKADPATYSPLVLAGSLRKATATSDFDTGDAVQLRFTADAGGTAGNDIRIVVTASDHGDASGPTVAYDDLSSPPLKLILVDLNTNSLNPSTAGQVVAAINAHGQAGAVVDAEIVSAAETLLTVSDPANYSPLGLTGGGGEIDLEELSGANTAQTSSDFNAANPLEVRFTAVAGGAAGNGIEMTFHAMDLGASHPP
ncbi:MAG TPA: matrixin family metalloprotease, partial [Candidatus Anammoximicrobium sp.]|nr:matrixin family metalloprotease [Candidatus Anammoximicrobium sp.]